MARIMLEHFDYPRTSGEFERNVLAHASSGTDQ
jgi:hypothetical protein